MWPIYTITGFDASAHTSEETVDAARNVPRGILRSVYLSGLFGWVMVASFVIAMPSVPDAARQGANIFPWLMEQIAPGPLGKALWCGIVIANYLCGLACVTSTSRMLYAFARDGGLPFSPALKQVSPRWKTPVAAIWATAALAVASTLYAPAYSTLTTACVIFLYVSYVMPTVCGFFTIGRSWTKMGPFDLGPGLYKAAGGHLGGGRAARGLDRRAAAERQGAHGAGRREPRPARRLVGRHAHPFPGPPVMSIAERSAHTLTSVR